MATDAAIPVDQAALLTAARRGLDRFEPRAPFRAWLYRIATNVCFRAIERRARMPELLDPEEAAVASYLQPYPDRLLEGEVEERESIGLAFVSVMQLLPPRQRAALVLRDVLGWTARDVADLLGDSVASVNSALQRARDRLTSARRGDSHAIMFRRRPRWKRRSCVGSWKPGRQSTRTPRTA